MQMTCVCPLICIFGLGIYLKLSSGFMYLRYTQPPGDLYDWYEDYLQDEEEIDVKAGGGQVSQLYEPPINMHNVPFLFCHCAYIQLNHIFYSFLGLCPGVNYWPDGVSVHDQVGLVLHALSAHTRAHTEAD